MPAKKRYGEERARSVTMTVPDSALAGLDQLAETLNLKSKSELITRIGLGQIQLAKEVIEGELSAS